MPSIKELYKRLDDVSIDADSINLNTDGLESLLATTQADIALIKADMANGVSGSGAFSTTPVLGTASAVTTFTSVTSATLIASNASRKMLTVYNSGAGILHILFGSGTASTSNFSVQLSSGDFYENDYFSGQINAIFATAGTARVTEVS